MGDSVLVEGSDFQCTQAADAADMYCVYPKALHLPKKVCMYPKVRPVNLRYGPHIFSQTKHCKSFLSFCHCHSDQMSERSQVSKARAAKNIKYKFQLVA